MRRCTSADAVGARHVRTTAEDDGVLTFVNSEGRPARLERVMLTVADGDVRESNHPLRGTRRSRSRLLRGLAGFTSSAAPHRWPAADRGPHSGPHATRPANPTKRLGTKAHKNRGRTPIGVRPRPKVRRQAQLDPTELSVLNMLLPAVWTF